VRRLGYVPGLDGLRAIAVALVVGYHLWNFPVGGWLGVDLFFVLSGFLITTLLLEEHAATGRIRFRAFYARRARRLLPALAVLLAGYLVVNAVRGTSALGLVARYGFYTGNVYEAFAPGAADRLVGLNHLWSLAQEEQFYLVWPAALLAVRRARRPANALVLVALGLVLYRAALVVHGASEARVYFAPDTNVDGLLLGSALAFHRRDHPSLPVPGLLVAVAAALAAVVVGAVPSLSLLNVAALPLFELASVVLIAAAAAGTLRFPQALIRLGGISYSLYLWHFPVFWAFHWQHPLLAAATSTAVASVSTRWIERPFRRTRPKPAAAHPLRASAVPAKAG
jgi:peptidoglycan/LPS O-acetylase OafA/YrhL